MQPKVHINNMQKKLNCRLYITIVMKKYEIEIDAMYLKSAETEQKYSLFDCIAMFLKKTPSPDISRGTREGLRKANKRTTTLCLRCIDGHVITLKLSSNAYCNVYNLACPNNMVKLTSIYFQPEMKSKFFKVAN